MTHSFHPLAGRAFELIEALWVPKTPSVQVKLVELGCSREGMDTFKFTRSCRFKAPR